MSYKLYSYYVLYVKYKADLYYVNMISFDLLKCEHNKYLSQCAKCKEHT